MTRHRRAILLVACLMAAAGCADDSSDAAAPEATADEATTTSEDASPETTERPTTTAEPETTTTTTTTTELPQADSITWTQSNGSDEYPLTVEFTATVTDGCSVAQESTSRWNIFVSGCLSVDALVTDSPFGAGGLATQGGIPLPNLAVIGTLDGSSPETDCTDTACARYPIGTYVPSDESCPEGRPAFVCEGSAWEYPIEDLTLPLAPSSLLTLAQYQLSPQADGVGQTVTVQEQLTLLTDGQPVPGDVAAAAVCELATVGGCS